MCSLFNGNLQVIPSSSPRRKSSISFFQGVVFVGLSVTTVEFVVFGAGRDVG